MLETAKELYVSYRISKCNIPNLSFFGVLNVLLDKASISVILCANYFIIKCP